MSKKREELETAATAAVQESGIQNLSFRTLADEVGVKSSSVHYYFPEKNDLIEVLIKRYHDAFLDQLKSIDQRRLTPRGKLDAFLKIFEGVLADDKFCLCGMMAAEIKSLNETHKALLRVYFKDLEDWLIHVIKQSEEPQDLRPRTLARVILSGLEGAILIDRVEGQQDRIKAQRELIRHLVK